jgi:hypothetical protein
LEAEQIRFSSLMLALASSLWWQVEPDHSLHSLAQLLSLLLETHLEHLPILAMAQVQSILLLVVPHLSNFQPLALATSPSMVLPLTCFTSPLLDPDLLASLLLDMDTSAARSCPTESGQELLHAFGQEWAQL